MHKRRSKRWLTAAVAGGALAAGAFAFLPSLAQATVETPQQSGVQADFTEAAAAYHVPRGVLMGVVHEVSGWQTHKGYNDNGGYGIAGLTDVTPQMMADGDAGAGGRADLDAMADRPELHTLQTASDLTGIPVSRLKTDTRSNLEGAAALLASYQKQLTGGLSANAADWTGAVAKFSQIKDQKAATSYVDDVYGTIRSGARRTVAGQTVQLTADPTAKPDLGQMTRLGLKHVSSSQAECPSTMDCTYDPVTITSSNGQVSDRPADGIQIDRIVIHTAEGSYDDALQTLQAADATTSAHYLMASDGTTTQLMADKDLAFAVGNYHYNMHSISIEHEGYTAEGASWYTDAAYQQTADLVKYLSQRFGVPLDRQHILGHDDIPGSLDSNLAAQHWDPGTAWDWNRFMRLLGAPTDSGRHSVGKVGSVVTIAPDFKTNRQTYTICPSDDPTMAADSPCVTSTQASNSLFVRSAPSAKAPLILDPVMHPDATEGTNEISDWSDHVQAGQQFVVAGVQGDWTGIWFDGQEGWIYNPGGKNTVPAHGVIVLKAAGTTAAPVYGQAYPAASEYPAGLSPSTQKPLTAANYHIPVGQAYVADQPPAAADDFFPSNGAVVKGTETYYQAQFNNRTIYVNSADVTATAN